MTAHRSAFLAPLTIPPRGPHTYTLIFLHGRGDSASIFGPAFTADVTRSRRRYCNLKLIFPTPAPTFSTLFYRHISQWFDFNAGTDPKLYTREHLDGLRETVEHVHALIDAEIAAGIPEERILLGGLNQGCAVALTALLLGGRKLAGVMGMSGWLPFAGEIRRALAGKGMPVGALVNGSRDVDVPTWDADEATKMQERTKIIGMLRERVLQKPALEEAVVAEMLRTPAWLGHGDADEVIRYLVGREIYGALKALGMEVVWKRYREFPHRYKVCFTLTYDAHRGFAADFVRFQRRLMMWSRFGKRNVGCRLLSRMVHSGYPHATIFSSPTPPISSSYNRVQSTTT
jgi:lysophospholipase-2